MNEYVFDGMTLDGAPVFLPVPIIIEEILYITTKLSSSNFICNQVQRTFTFME